MRSNSSFRFREAHLNQKLIDLVRKAGIRHVLDRSGAIRYAEDDEEFVENELVSKVRSEVFKSWQILTCPGDWTQRYMDYMNDHRIPFHEELIDGELWFLIPRKYRPHAWKLSPEKKRQKAGAAH